MRIFSACRSATWALRRGRRTVTRPAGARTRRLLREGLQSGLGAVEVLLGLAARDAHRAQHRAFAADQRRPQSGDDGHPDHLGDLVEEARALLVDLRQLRSVPVPDCRAHRLGLGDLRGERRRAVHSRQRLQEAPLVDHRHRDADADLPGPVVCSADQPQRFFAGQGHGRQYRSAAEARMAEAALAGIRVLEVGNFMAAPFCTLQLADLGADVVKIENPDGGDQTRASGPFLEGESSSFLRLNRNKRSVALDLKAPRGKQVFRTLAARADVLVENLRPGTMKDLELDYPRLSEINPRLVYVAASGWGQDGPYAQRPGLDIMAQGMSGLMSITGEEGGRNPVKVGVPVTDLTCALYAAIAALAALRVRERTGRGQFIDVSLFESGVSLAVWEAGQYFATGEIPKPLGSAHQTSAPYQALRAADGYFTLGATTPRNWRSFCEVLDHPEWAGDERFKDNPSRHARRDVLIPMIEDVTSRKPRAHWVSLLQKAGVPCAEIRTYDQVYNDPQLKARGFFWKGRHSKLGDVEQIGSPIHFSETPVRQGSAGPVLGEHTSEVLRALGRSDAEISELKAKGVLGGT